jgi:putative lipoprotein
MEFGLAFVILTGSFGGPQQHVAQPDRWFARDKALHFAASFVIQAATHSVLRANRIAYRDAALTAGMATLTAGVGKEMWDVRQGKPWSWKDLTADAVGGGAGAVVMAQVGR